jgi:hypothetical protein
MMKKIALLGALLAAAFLLSGCYDAFAITQETVVL